LHVARSVVLSRPLDAAGVEAADIIFLNAYPGWYQHPGQLDVAESVLGGTLDRLHQRYKSRWWRS
jgi:hypothetical protein